MNYDLIRKFNLRDTRYIDRNQKLLEVGQRIRVQVCIGRHGQTAIRQGEIVELSPYGGATIKTEFAFTEDCGRFGLHDRPAGSLIYVCLTRTGYEKFDDFKHGHESWTEIITDA